MDFNEAAKFVLGKEGGFSDDPTDRGGATNFGISSKAHPDVDVKSLTKEKAQQIYKSEYWDAIGADSLPENMRLAAFDLAINSGTPTAIKMIEASGGDVNKLLTDRATKYKQIIAADPTQKRFENGWNNRLTAVSNHPSTTGQAAAPSSNVDSAIARQAAGGSGINTQLQTLRNAGHADEISYALSQGFSPKEIVAKFAGGAQAQGQAAKAQADARGFVGNLVEGAGDAVGDIGRGASRIGSYITGAQEDFKRKAAEQREIDGSLDRIATGGTAGGVVGNIGTKAIPSVVAGIATGGASVPAQIAVQGGVGAAMGALENADDGAGILSNMGVGAAMGAAGQGAASALTAAPKAVGRAGQSYLRGGEDAATIEARQALLKANGIDAPATMLTGRAAQLGQKLEDNIPFAGAFGANKGSETATKQAYRALTKSAGHEVDSIDSVFVNAAEDANGKLYSQALDGVEIQLPGAQRQQIIASLERQIREAPSDIRQDIANQYSKELIALKAGGNKIDARTLQSIRSNIGSDGAALTLTGQQKAAYGKVYRELSDTLKNGLSGKQLEAFNKANTQYANLQPLKKAVASSGDNGAPTAKQLLNTIKTGRSKNDFIHGDAVHQDILEALAAASKGSDRGVGPIATGAVAGHFLGAGAAALPVGANVLNRALNNPKLANLLLGLNKTQRSAVLSKLMGGAEGAVAGVAPSLTSEQQDQLGDALGASAPGAQLPKLTPNQMAMALKYRT